MNCLQLLARALDKQCRTAQISPGCICAPSPPKFASARGALCWLLGYGWCWLKMDGAKGRQLRRQTQHQAGLCSSPPASGPGSAVSVCPSFSATCTQPCIAAAEESPHCTAPAAQRGLHQPAARSDLGGKGRERSQGPQSLRSPAEVSPAQL